MAILASDFYPDSDGTPLRNHIIQSAGILDYDYPILNDYEIHFSSVRNEIAAPPRCRMNFDQAFPIDASDFVVNVADIFRGATDSTTQIASIGIGCDSISVGPSYDESGIWAEARRIDSIRMSISVVLTDGTGTITRQELGSRANWPVGTGLRLEIERIGIFVIAYTSDISTGLNRFSHVVLVLTAPEQAFYDDGDHQDGGLLLTGSPESAAMLLSSFTLSDSFIPSTPISATVQVDYSSFNYIVENTVEVDYDIIPNPIVSISVGIQIDYDIVVAPSTICFEPAAPLGAITFPTPTAIICPD